MRKPGYEDMALLTDLYEFTMAASYFRREMFAPATFSLFIRNYPPHRGYFVSAGLEDVLSYLEKLHFTDMDLEYLRTTQLFSDDFLHYLGGLRFTGDVFAIPEGRIFFKDEPVIEVTAPLIEAQLVETFVINAISFQVSIATKAARCVYAAAGRELVDFSLRRTHGADAGLKAARSSYIAGFDGTSNTLAGKLYGIPVAGTMAHSYVISFEDEIDAFRAFADVFPRNTVLLIDTYDTVNGARKAAIVGKEMLTRGYRLKGVRLDSGDIAGLSREVRGVLREAGLGDATIFASGAFDEYEIAKVLSKGGDIDAFGVGTKMGVSADAPYTDSAYKLVDSNGRPVLKLSKGKQTLVCDKQVYREMKGGKMVMDTIALRNEKITAEPILKRVMTAGQRDAPPESLDTMRARFRADFSSLDERYKVLKRPARFPVQIAPGLKDLQSSTVRQILDKELGNS